jgi:hypothetical protein
MIHQMNASGSAPLFVGRDGERITGATMQSRVRRVFRAGPDAQPVRGARTAAHVRNGIGQLPSECVHAEEAARPRIDGDPTTLCLHGARETRAAPRAKPPLLSDSRSPTYRSRAQSGLRETGAKRPHTALSAAERAVGRLAQIGIIRFIANSLLTGARLTRHIEPY